MEKRLLAAGPLTPALALALLALWIGLPALAQVGNQAPVAECADVVDPPLEAGWSCEAAASVDAGSWDPDGDSVTAVQSPAGPYGLGDTLVTLTVSDPFEATDSCEATVRVVDAASPVIDCGVEGDITVADLPASFTSGATDNCSVDSVVIEAADCVKYNKSGREVSRNCDLSWLGDTVTLRSGQGPSWTLRWSVLATDGSGNTLRQSCSVEVGRSGNGKGPNK